MKKKLQFIDIILLLIQLVGTCFILFLVKSMLPTKYLLALAIILLIVLISIFLLMHSKKSISKILGRFISLILGFVLVIGSLYVTKGFKVLNNITDGRYETTVLSVVVLEDSSYEKLEDLQDMTIGISKAINQASLEDIHKKIDQVVTVKSVEYELMNQLVDSLYDNNSQAIIINEGLRGMIEELYDNFSEQTRVIFTSQTVQEVEVIQNHNFDVTKDTFSVYISGIDTYGPVNTISRSDVNMIVTINPKTKEILMTSIPRDYHVILHSFNAYDKLTHAGIYGVNESLTTLEDLFDIDIQYYARVNFSSLITIVDALDGIIVSNPNEFVSTHGGYYFPIGDIEMDGNMALGFSRERYSFSNGDRERIKNQQRVLSGIINKLMTPTIITNYSSILDAISDCLQTNMTSTEIQKLISMQLNDMSSWKIKQISVDGYGDTSYSCFSMPGPGLYVMTPDYDTVSQASNQIKDMYN